VWVTGNLGGSLLGKHLYFEPRLPEGKWLSEQPDVRAMMDITDGPVADLPKLCPGEQEAVLRSAAIPVSQDAHRLSAKTGQDPLWHALHDGEDYELAFVLSGEIDPAELEARWKSYFATALTCIGTMQKQSKGGRKISFSDRGKDSLLDVEGYEHFRGKRS